MQQARFDILRDPEHGTYRWKLQVPDGKSMVYICQSALEKPQQMPVAYVN